MLRKIKEQYLLEDKDLSIYATHNLHSKGRRFPEKPHPFRTDFQRDRDRILHSRAFRRLEYKTQVFLNGKGDHYRTRLTHTIEVAAIARTIARALYLNEDLAETIALAHDLGHTPFGHSGEYAINELMQDHGGFDHNRQALTVVDVLEEKYPDYDGLNLTWEVRTGLIKHRDSSSFLDDKKLENQPHLESQVADIADDLTYYGHDVDDGLESGLLDEKMFTDNKLWNLACERALERGVKLITGSEKSRGFIVRCLIDMMVQNVILNSEKNLQPYSKYSSADIQKIDKKLISFSSDFEKLTLEHRKFLYKNLYHHPDVDNVNNNAVQRMRHLFQIYLNKPELMSVTAVKRAEKVGLHRAVADYIAGMTDRFAIIEFKKHHA
jgi:dGTPase